MQGYTERVRTAIHNFSEEEIFVASEVKKKLLPDIPEAIYYKALERFVKQRMLVHLTKGLYYRPSMIDGEICPLSQETIVDYYVSDKGGMVIGEGLIIETGIGSRLTGGEKNRLSLLSNRLIENKKHVEGISVEKLDLEFDEVTTSTIQTLDILRNYDKIQDMNKDRLVAYLRAFSQKYSDDVVEYVLKNYPCQKKTIAFLKEVLDWFDTYNCLEQYLSPMSKYNIPAIEELKLEIPSHLTNKLQEYVEKLQRIYGQHLLEVILYGSYAKGNYDRDESDIDIMILVDITDEEAKKYRKELSGVTYDFNVEYNLDIKPITKSQEDFVKWEKEYPFYNSVREEGVYLYGAA